MKSTAPKRSKEILSFWMKKGWLQYVSLKTENYQHIKEYVKELYEEQENYMNIIAELDDSLENGTVERTPEVEKQKQSLELIHEAIWLELQILHDKYEPFELYMPNTRYSGIEMFQYADDVLPKGLYYKVENLLWETDQGEDYAVYLYLEEAVTTNNLIYVADRLMDMKAKAGDPSIEVTILSNKDIEEIVSKANLPKEKVFKRVDKTLSYQ